MSHLYRHFSLAGNLAPLPDSSVKDAGCGYIHYVEATGYFILICATDAGFYYKEYDKNMKPTPSNWTWFSEKVGADNVTQVIDDRLILAQMTVWPSGTSEWNNSLIAWEKANLAPNNGNGGYLSWSNGWNQAFGWKVESFLIWTGGRKAPFAPFMNLTKKKEVLIPIVASDGMLEEKYKSFRAANGLPALKRKELKQYLEAESGGPMIHRISDDPSDLTFAITTDYLKNGMPDFENPAKSGLGGLGTHHWLLDIDLNCVDPYQVIITSNSDSTKSPKETVPHYGFVTHINDQYLWRRAPPRGCELSIVPTHNKINMITCDWNWGNLIVLEFDPDWNYQKPGAKSTLPYLELDSDSDVERANFPTGAVWDKDGKQFIVTYIDTTKRKDLGGGKTDWQNIRLARYDQSWEMLEDIAITKGRPNDTLNYDPIAKEWYLLLPCIPWLVQSGTRIYVSFHDRKVFVKKFNDYIYEIDPVPYGGNVYIYDLMDSATVQKPFLGVLPVKDEPGVRLETRIPPEELTALVLQETKPLVARGVTHIDRKAKITVMTRDAAASRSIQKAERRLHVMTQKPGTKT
jgi:hypothetical protein